VKSCGHSLGTTFIPQLSKVLSVDAVAPQPQRSDKWPKNSKKSVFWRFFFKVEVQKLNFCAYLSRLIKIDQKKITLDILWWKF
jgi:hypothetical protein